MDNERLEVLEEAQKIRQRKEDMERAIGRALRKTSHDFQYYVALVSELREMAASKGVSIDQVVEGLLAKQKNADNEGRYKDDSGN